MDKNYEKVTSLRKVIYLARFIITRITNQI